MFLQVRRNLKLEGENEPSFETVMHAINYKDGKAIIKQKTTVQELDFDPSEYFDWKLGRLRVISKQRWRATPSQKSKHGHQHKEELTRAEAFDKAGLALKGLSTMKFIIPNSKESWQK